MRRGARASSTVISFCPGSSARLGTIPAIDVLNSISRLQSKITAREQQSSMRALRQALASYHQSEDLIQLGAYVAGSNAVLDRSIQLRPEIMNFLRQEPQTVSPLEETVAGLSHLAARLGDAK